MNRQEREHLYDESLVVRVQLGEPAAFDELVGRWQQRLWRCARLQTGNDAAAWDVVQETWVTVINKIRKLDNPRSFPAWVYRIVSSSAANWRRRRDRDRRLQNRLASEASQRGNSQDAPSLDAAGRLDAALKSLSPGHLAVVSLHYCEGFNIKYIAEILHVPAGTVKSRLYHARQRLQERLGGDWNE